MSDYLCKIDLSARELFKADDLYELVHGQAKDSNKSLLLDLSCNNFREFPKSICKSCFKIHTLLFASQLNSDQFYDAGTLGLTELPYEISELSETLEHLDLFNNKISRLPCTFIQLDSLKELNVSKNNFHVFPAELCQLKQLQILRLCGNHITYIPREIKNLQSLVSIYLDHNELTELSKFLCELHLKVLSLRGNKLTKLPHQKFDLHQLEDIPLDSFSSSSNSDVTFESLHELKELDLSLNLFEDFPDCICALEKLEILNLNENSISRLPRNLVRLKELRILKLDSNKLKSVPLFIGRLDNLELASFIGNNIKKIPLELNMEAKKIEIIIEGAVEKRAYVVTEESKDKRMGVVTDATQQKDSGYQSGVSLCSAMDEGTRGLSGSKSTVSLDRTSVDSDSMLAMGVSPRTRGCMNTARPASLESACGCVHTDATYGHIRENVKGFDKLTEPFLMDIAEHLALRDALKLGIELNISETRVENIEQQYPHDARRVMFKILKTWRDSISVDDEDEAVDKLEDVLCKIGKNCLCGRFKTAVECNKTTEQSFKQTTV